MKKSYIKYFIFVVLAVIFFYSLYLALSSKKTTGPAGPSPSGPVLTVPAQNGGSVQVNDFTQTPARVVGDTTVIAETADYGIVYFTQDKSFLITIRSLPAEASRAEAETELLSKLGIGQTDACKLTVALTVPAGVSEPLSGQDYGLSFCPSGKPFSAQ